LSGTRTLFAELDQSREAVREVFRALGGPAEKLKPFFEVVGFLVEDKEAEH
jgi:hypothetical protein